MTEFRSLNPSKFPHFGPRVHFNWGYHNAHSDSASGTVRELRDTGPSCPQVLSRESDPFYFEGYRAGLKDAGNEQQEETSTQAWRDFWAQQSPEGQGLIIELEAQADLAGITRKNFNPLVWRQALEAASARILEH